MPNETSKSHTRRTLEGFYTKYLQGLGLDIGYGGDLIHPTARGWDLQDGDAQYLKGLHDESFDYVYSSHCLEHMVAPFTAIENWWRVLKPHGYLIIVVPDEDLYEQGVWPSIFNPDHKATFTPGKTNSWSPNSISMHQLLKRMPNHHLISLRTVDTNYNYGLPEGTVCDQTAGNVEAAIEMIVRKVE